MNSEPVSIATAARLLKLDRGALADALVEARQIDHIKPTDYKGTRGCPRYLLSDCCEAAELRRVRQAPPDLRPWSEELAAEYAAALAKACPRCGGQHVEMPILPLPGRA
jgi:hypothetical protein